MPTKRQLHIGGNMTDNARQILADAHARAERRDAATTRVDYKALNEMVRRQKAALTRAKNSGDPNKVIIACRNAVREWDQPGGMWPDNWSNWQRALDDVLPWSQQVDLRDLR